MSGLRDRNRRAAMADVQRTAMSMMQVAGFSNVTVEEIAVTAGVSASTVYRYFGTKEALVLWGDRATRVVAEVAAANVGKKLTVEAAFVEAAATAYDDPDAMAQLHLVFANPELTIAFEHELMSQRHALGVVVADHRQASSVGWRDISGAGSMLGALIAVLERWSTTGGDKALAKQLAKAFDTTR
jgi:AcrR family transcriptional regulator